MGVDDLVEEIWVIAEMAPVGWMEVSTLYLGVVKVDAAFLRDVPFKDYEGPVGWEDPTD